ncbi:MAG: hypothetical protein KGL39_22010 [Patescibacteria group bacterium]|nr:hypothetical protein [Patescibacteria group bacterium]
MILTNTDPGNLQVDGVYVDVIAAPPQIPQGPATGLIAIVGGANYGPLNVPIPFSDDASLKAAFGNDTTSSHSLVREALSAMPEGQQFVGVRVAHGLATAASIAVLDGSSGTVLTLTSKFPGSLPNNSAYVTVQLQSGSSGSLPVLQVQIGFPGQPTEVYSNIVANTGGAYSSSTFIANAVALINGQVANRAGSPRWTASAGASSVIPAQGTLNYASGGTDGNSGITTSDLFGTDGYNGTGLYALDGLVSGGQVMLASCVDPAAGANLIAFATRENCLAHLTFPLGTGTATAIASRASNALANPNLILDMDWDLVFDVQSGQQMYVSPMGKIAGIISAQPSYLSPGNQPVAGASGIIATERITGGLNTVNQQEAAARQQAGLLWLGYMPRAVRGPELGLPHGMTSDGITRICDSRMLKRVVYDLQAIEGPLVDGPMSVNSSNLGQPTWGLLQDAADGYFGSLLNGQPQQISDYSFLLGSSNTPATVAAGQLIPSVLVTTLSSAQFIVNLVQVGPTVQAQVQTVA